MRPSLSPDDISLGLLAGGRGSRLGGIDKAWLTRDGLAQVERWRRRFADETGRVLVSANRDLQRYADAGLTAVPDRASDFGPVAGLEALANVCATTWLLTLPVDLVGVNECLLQTLIAERDEHGAFAVDDDGTQPLVALWNVQALRAATAQSITRGEHAVQRLTCRAAMTAVRFQGVRFGNLNTPDDLAAAGVVVSNDPKVSRHE